MTVGRSELATYTLILSILGAGGCGEAPATQHDSVASVSQALAPQVGAALDVQKYPTPQRAFEESPNQIVCGMQRCLQFISGRLGTSGWGVYAAPITDQGTPLSPRHIVGPGYLTTVAAKGDEFLAVITNSDVNAYSSTQTAVLLDGATGSVKKSVVLKPRDGSREAVSLLAGTGSSWAYLRSFEGTTSTSLVLLDGTTLATRELTGPLLADQYTKPLLVAGSNQYLMYAPGYAWRIDATTGAVLDSTPIVLSKYSRGQTAAAFVNDHHHLVWTVNGSVYSARLGTDGKMLDADDDFNQRTGARLVCSSCSAVPSASPIGLGFDGTTLTAAWVTGTGYVAGTRLAPATGAPLGVAPEGSASLQDGVSRFVVDKTTVYATGSREQIYPIKITPSPYTWANLGTSVGTVRNPDNDGPSVAHNGSSYFVAWSNGTSLVGTRVNPATGMYENDPPLVLSELPSGVSGILNGAVVAVGASYVAAWTTSQCTAVYTRRVGSDGSLGPVTATPMKTNPCSEVRLAGNGDLAMVAWWERGTLVGFSHLFAMRIGADGVPVAPEAGGAPNQQVMSPSPQRPTLDVIADTTPPPAQRTFGVYVTSLSDSNDGSGFGLVRVRSKTGAVVDPFVSVYRGNWAVSASDGTSMFIATRSLPDFAVNAPVMATLLDPVTGNTTTPVAIEPSESRYRPAKAWFDGKSYLMISQSTTDTYGQSTLTVRRFSPTDLTSLDGTSGADATLVEGRWIPYSPRYIAAASAGDGRSLIAYSAGEPRAFARAIKVRLLTNDGKPAPTGTGGSTSSGGATGSTGGAATSGGATGSTGGTSSGGATGSTGGTSSGGAAESTGGASAGGGLDAGTGGPGTGGTASERDGSAPRDAAANGGSAGSSGGGGGGESTGGATSSGASVTSSGGGTPDESDAGHNGSASNSSGCSCRVADRGAKAPFLALGIAGLVTAAFARRRRTVRY